MKPARLILLSGMAGDGRLMQPIRIPGIEILTPNHLKTAPGEGLSQYALRIAERLGIGSTDVIGGASFGGMVAAEIARQRPVAGLVLLGTCLEPARLPGLYRWVERLGRFTPDFILHLRSWPPLVRWRFAPLTPAAERCLITMAADFPAAQIREFGRMLMGWPGVEHVDCPVLSVHGARDRIIPLACAKHGIVLQDAGHAFTLTHAERTSAAISEFLHSLGSISSGALIS